MKREDLGVLSPAEQASKPDGYVSVFIEVNGIRREIEADVFAKWHQGEPRTHSHPGATRGWEIQDVRWQGMYLTPLLSEDQLDAIAKELG